MTSFTISSFTTSAQTLKAGETGVVNATMFTSSTVSVTWDLSGSSTTAATLTNNNLIQGGTGRALDTTGTSTVAQSFTITNGSLGRITGGTDVMRIQKSLLGGTFTLDNSGTITAQNGRGFNFQDYDRLNLTVTNRSGGVIQSTDDVFRLTRSSVTAFTGTVSITNSGTMKTTSTANGQVLDLSDLTTLGTGGSLTVTNNAGALMQAANSDAIRGAAGTTINNYGTIEAKLASGTTTNNNAIDFKGNAGGTVNNFEGGSIIGAHHGITNSAASPLTVAPGIAINNDGVINGLVGSGINLDTASTTTVTITNGVHGTITGHAGTDPTGAASDGDGIDVDGLVVITNNGTIEALGLASGTGALPLPTNEAITVGGGTITNNAGGVIHSVQRAITVDDSNLGNAFAKTTITNHGTITGDNGEAIVITSLFDDQIINDGTINGSIVMGNGNVTIRNNGGTINGAVTTGSGHDQIYQFGTVTGAINMGLGSDSLILGSVHAHAVGLGTSDNFNDVIVIWEASHAYLDGAVTGAEYISLGISASLDVASSLGGAIVSFGNTSAQQLILSAATLAAGDFTVTGLGNGDTIDLKGVGTPLSVSLGSNYVLSVAGSTGTASVQLSALDYSALRFHAASDGGDGALITVVNNSAPVSANDNASGFEDTVLTGTVSASDADNDNLTYSLVTGAHGSLTFNSDGSWSYTPDADFNGTDSFTWIANDGTASSTHGTVSIVVAAVNDAPVNSVPGPQTVAEDGTLVFSTANGNAISVSDIDSGLGDVVVTVQGAGNFYVAGAAVQSGVHGLNGNFTSTVLVGNNGSSVVVIGGLVADVSLALQGLIFQPTSDTTGDIELTVTTRDFGATGIGGAQIDVDTIAISIAAVNDAPALTGTQAVLAHATEDTAYTVTKAQLLQGFGDVDGDTLSVGVLSVDHGTATENLDGSWTISLDANYNGALAISYAVLDGNGGSTAASLSATVDAVNDAPVREGSATGLSTPEDTPITFSASDLVSSGFFDADGDELTVSNVFASNATVTDNGNGTFTLTPDANFNGRFLALNFTVDDGHGGRLDTSVNFEVEAVNDAPSNILRSNYADPLYEGAATGFAVANFIGVDPDDIGGGSVPEVVTLSLVSDSTNGGFTLVDGDLLVADGSKLDFATTPVAHLVIRATDLAGTTFDKAFDIPILNVNEAPVIAGGASASATVAENTTAVTTIVASDPDAGTVLAYTLSGADAVLFNISASGVITFKSAPNFEAPADTGRDNIYNVTVTASDGTLSDTQALAITVTDVSELNIITGTAGKDTITGSTAADRLLGLGGSDTLLGLAGDDVLDGGLSNDKMSGGQGNDTYIVDVTGDRVTENVDEGTDTVQTALVKYTLGANVENLTFTSNVAHFGNGNELANHLIGGAGNDVLNGRAGADALEGGLGSDTYYVDNTGDTVTEGTGTGTDSVFATVSFTLSANIENLTLRTSVTALQAIGNAGNNVLIGNGNANTLSGLDGNDTLRGGKGTDTLTGGAGADAFVFHTRPSTSNLDTVTDFVSGTDTLVFDQSAYGAFTAVGAISAAAFWSGAGVNAAHDADDRLIYNTTTGALWFDADGTGKGKAVQVAVLGGHPELAFGDILIVA